MAPARFIVLHGWQGSGPDHWQSWLAGRLDPVAFPVLPDPDLPQLAPWLGALRDELARAAPEPVVVCHSLGCVLWLHYAATRGPGDPRASRVLLVAPPCACSHVPEIASFFPVPRDAAATAAAADETRLVCSDHDPYCPEGATRAYGEPLAVPMDVVCGGGHLNPDAGYGAWPAVEEWALGRRAAAV